MTLLIKSSRAMLNFIIKPYVDQSMEKIEMKKKNHRKEEGVKVVKIWPGKID